MTPAEARRAHDIADYCSLLIRKTNQPTKGSGLGAPTHVPRNGSDK